MKGPDQLGMWSVGAAEDLPDVPWAKDGFSATDEEPLIDPLAGLASLGFLRAALRRRWKLWLSLTLIGFLMGCGLFVGMPAPYQAATTVLLIDGPNENAQYQIFNDEALAGSTAVASAVIKQLGLQESPAALLGSISVTAPSSSALTITASAPSSAQALRLATTTANAFLRIRSRSAQVEEQELEQELNGQLTQAQQHSEAANAKVNAAPSNISADKLADLKANQQTATAALTQLQTDIPSSILDDRSATKAEQQNSQVIDAAAPLKHTHIKTVLYEVGGGFFGGLVLGVGIVVISAIISDRLRRRDDIAATIGAPVDLSVGPLRASRLPAIGGQAKRIARDRQRVVDYLASLLPAEARGQESLGIVAVDDEETAARLASELAAVYARRDRRVLLADLSDGRHLARRLDSTEPGVRKVTADGAYLMLAVPEPNEIAPIGPLPVKAGASRSPEQAVLAAGRGCDLVITLASLNPAYGGDYLSTWAANAVVLVTAGQSSASRIRGVGEMVRLAGTRLRSVVLIDADSADDSLGARGLSAASRSR